MKETAAVASEDRVYVTKRSKSRLSSPRDMCTGKCPFLLKSAGQLSQEDEED